MYGIKEYIDACRDRQHFLSSQAAQFEEERRNYHEDAERLEALLDRTRKEMVGYLLPEVDDDALAALEARLSYPGLLPIKRGYEARLAEVQARCNELEAMDEIEFHELKLDQTTKEIEEVRHTYDEYRRKLSVWENSKWFRKLDKRGYFDPDYVPTLINRFFDWRAASFLMSELAGKARLRFSSPQALPVHYRGLKLEAEPVFEVYASRTSARERLVALKAEYDELQKTPERLLSELYGDLGSALLDHLHACPVELRFELARGDPNLSVFLKKEVGVNKQAQYLRELAVTRIDTQVQRLQQELQKLDGKLQKLEWKRRRGRRKQYSATDIQRMRAVKAEKWEKRQKKIRDVRTKIVNFDRYERGSFATDFLWWDLVTRGARGDDIYEAKDFHARHPDWDYKTYRDPWEAEPAAEEVAIDGAAAALASSMTTPDDEIFHDAT